MPTHVENIRLIVVDLRPVLDREVEQLSGGELQRFAIAVACVQKADVYVHLEYDFSTLVLIIS